jgi:arsenate reductase
MSTATTTCERFLGRMSQAVTPVGQVVMDDRDRQYTVLFLGNGNAARSIMAEAILNREGGEKFRAYSAGIAPARELDPHAVDLLKRLQFDLSGAHPKDWSELAGEGAPVFDFVFTVCDHATLLPRSMWKSRPLFAHWGIDDPARAEGGAPEIEVAYADAFRMLSTRISIFVNLPLRALGHLATQQELDTIGGKQAKTTVVAA